MDNWTRAEHAEFAARIDERFKRRDDENNRQNHRLDVAEKRLDQLNEIIISVREMTTQLKAMTAELAKQGERLEAIEKEPAENWKKAVWYVMTAILGACLAIIGQRLGV